MIVGEIGVNAIVQLQAEIVVLRGKIQFAFLKVKVRMLSHGLPLLIGLSRHAHGTSAEKQ